MRFTILLIILLSVYACQDTGRNIQIKTFFTQKVSNSSLINKNGKTVKARFNTPKNYIRISTQKGSFANYLQNFPLKKHASKVHLFNGQLKYRQDIHAAILDIDVGNRDLQQCADATMRLRAEYLYRKKKYNQIHFKFTNGFNAKYSKWRLGYRIKVNNNTVTWIKTAKPSDSYASFKQYLRMVFSYAGTLSLSRELPSVNKKDSKIGDLFIQGGSPGHAIIIMDMATNATGDKIILLAQSYMPAQDIHILKNPDNTAISPWYSLKNLETLVTPEWIFTKNNIKRFY